MYQTKLQIFRYQFTNNCMPNALHRGKMFDVKNDEKRVAAHYMPFLSLFWVYVRLYLRNERSLQSESYLCFELHTVSHIWA